jgi:hypothetical protein
MKNKLTQLAKGIYNVKTWRWTVLVMIAVLISGAVYYAINFLETSRPHVTISKKELKKGKVNKDLAQTDEVESEASFEDFNAKYKALSRKIPKAEWKLTQREMTDAEYQVEYDKYLESKERRSSLLLDYYSYGITPPDYLYSDPVEPTRIKTFPYSMKGFMDEILKGYDTDSTDFDTKIRIVEKIDHFLEMTDKKSADTLLVDKFKSILVNSKDLSIEEMKAVEKLHKSITKTKLVFSLTAPNSDQERQTELFEMYEAAANGEITEARFTQLDALVKQLKTKKIKDTVVVLNVLTSVMKTDFSKYKEEGESVDELEMQCIDDFFMSGKIDFTKDDVQNKYNKYTDLFGKKLEAANLEKKAREQLREENRKSAGEWVFNGLLFAFMGVIIVFMAKLNSRLKTNNTI